ncbi:MAG TPA: 8-amino-7-oxononanoate synthase [Burkholderiales bacterium]|nr:8-amino-7-oxononanoate synthase [Burkholderiales bacterium]
MKIPDLAPALAALDGQRLLRQRRSVHGALRPRTHVGGRELLCFASNDYLGLAADPRIAEAACRGAQELGVGAGASHLVCGHNAAHEDLEVRLAQFVEAPRALLFSTGYMANLGIVTALLDRHDAVFADRLNHACLNDAALLSRAVFRRYPHGDLDALERLLAASTAPRKLVATDAVFSMDGDMAPVPELLALCERFGAWLLLDDAHGFGVLGRDGRGTPSHCGVRSPNLIYMGTLGKAAGVFGAFVAGEATLIDLLVQRARPYIYTTALPPLLARALLASVDVIEREGWRRERLASLIAQLKSSLRPGRMRLLESSTPIQPLLVGGNEAALAVGAALEDAGIWVPVIRPPTVPKSTARLRISLSAAHSEADVALLLDHLNRLQ